jgi:hypothetical protein
VSQRVLDTVTNTVLHTLSQTLFYRHCHRHCFTDTVTQFYRHCHRHCFTDTVLQTLSHTQSHTLRSCTSTNTQYQYYLATFHTYQNWLSPFLHSITYLLPWEYSYWVWNKVGKCCFIAYRSTDRCSVAKFVWSLWGVTRAIMCAGAISSRRFEWERLSGMQFVVFLTRCWFLAESSLVLISRHTRYCHRHLFCHRGHCQVGTCLLLGVALEQNEIFCFWCCDLKYRIAW